MWTLCRRAGFNILFFGLGSKRDLINEFAMHLEGGGVIAVNGYQNGMTANKIVATVAKVMLGESYGKCTRCAGGPTHPSQSNSYSCRTCCTMGIREDVASSPRDLPVSKFDRTILCY